MALPLWRLTVASCSARRANLCVETEGLDRRRKEADRPEYGQRHIYRQHWIGDIGRRACERENPGRIAQALQPGQKIPGTPATHEAVDGIRGLQYGSSRSSEFFTLNPATQPARWRHEPMDINVFDLREGFPAQFDA